MGLAAGRLDRRISLQRRTDVQNADGEPVPSWAEFAEVAASVRYQNGGERFEAMQRIGEAMVTFRIRWSSDVASVGVKDRIVFDGRTYDIRNRSEVGRREGIDLDATVRSEDSIRG